MEKKRNRKTDTSRKGSGRKWRRTNSRREYNTLKLGPKGIEKAY